MSKLLQPSIEQRRIIDEVLADNDVVVHAVAGSGKTTSLMFLCESLLVPLLQITYNTELNQDTRKKINEKYCCEMAPNNICQSFTYHGLATYYYTDSKTESPIKDDKMLFKIIKYDRPLKKNKHFYGVIALDEVQDMTPLLYRFMCKFIKDIGFTGRLVLLGDERQCIYKYLNANEEYLTNPEKYWNRKFKHLTLSTSYRVTKPIANFINKCLIKKDIMVSHKNDGAKVQYYKCDLNNKNEYLTNIIKNELVDPLRNGKYRFDDVFILVRSPDRRIARVINEIVDTYPDINHHICMKSIDNEKKEVKQNKVCTNTYHSSKGREKKLVILCGFDDISFYGINKPKDASVCPNILYVAASRAKEKLVILQQIYKNYDSTLEFIDKKELNNNQDIETKEYATNLQNSPSFVLEARKTGAKKISVTNLVNHLPSEIEIKIDELLQFDRVAPQRKPKIPIKTSIEFFKGPIGKKRSYKESVCDINGIAIPILWYSKNKKGERYHEVWHDMYRLINDNNSKNKIFCIRRKRLRELFRDCEFNEEFFLLLTNLYLSIIDRFNHRLNQINKYDWLKEKDLTEYFEYFDKHIKGKLKIEKPILYNTKYCNGIEIKGIIDIIDDDTLWEVKCTDDLTNTHKLQLLLYAWLYNQKYPNERNKKKFKLINIKTGEVLELKYDEKNATKIVELLLNYKYKENWLTKHI